MHYLCHHVLLAIQQLLMQQARLIKVKVEEVIQVYPPEEI